MHLRSAFFAGTVFGAVLLLVSPSPLAAQSTPPASIIAAAGLPDAPQAQAVAPQNSQSDSGQGASQGAQEVTTPAGASTTPKHKPPPEPRRILGIMPNWRAISAGVLPPPPTPRRAFVIATQNSFDYSSYIFVGITSLMAEGSNDHPQLGKGVPGFWGYYWRGFVDKTDGNYWVIWIMPTMTHEDERYYAKGEGSIFDRGIYAASRVLITPSYHGKNTFNASEVFGRGISQAISLTYYPSAEQSLGPFMEKYGYAVGRDAVTNVFREFWPDIDAHLFHRHRVNETGPG